MSPHRRVEYKAGKRFFSAGATLTTNMDPRLGQALTLHQRGDVPGALGLYDALLKEQPHDAVLLHYRGLASFHMGDLAGASDFITRSVALDGSDADAWCNLGMVFAKQNNPAQALRLLQRALELNPTHLDALHNKAVVLKSLHREKEALSILQHIAKTHPRAIGPLCNLAATQQQLGDTAGAAATYENVLKIAPDDETARCGLGEAYEALGRFGAARDQYSAVLQRNPNNAWALVKTLELRDPTADIKWVDQATQLAARADLSADARIRLNVALAQYHDRGKHYDTAFLHLKRGCDEQFRRQPFDSAGYSKLVDTFIATLDAGFLRTAAVSGNTSARPIFIVGLPRSGTTLVEQVLSSHSAVAAGGELPTLPQVSFLTKELSRSHEHYPVGVRTLSTDALARMADQYLKHLTTLSADAQRVTDKLPFNFMHIGLIALLFPNAKIVHCRRDPLDNCLSCYFTSFADQVQFASDLAALGRYYVDYDRLMRHWHGALPGRIFDIQYEELVSDTQSRIEALLAFCELPWEEACLRFHETQRGIHTPSRWQVRQPIYAQSVQRWRHYEAHLGPLRSELSPIVG